MLARLILFMSLKTRVRKTNLCRSKIFFFLWIEPVLRGKEGAFITGNKNCMNPVKVREE